MVLFPIHCKAEDFYYTKSGVQLLILNMCSNLNESSTYFVTFRIMKLILPTLKKSLLHKCHVSPFEFALDHKDNGNCVRALVEGGIDVNYRSALTKERSFITGRGVQV